MTRLPLWVAACGLALVLIDSSFAQQAPSEVRTSVQTGNAEGVLRVTHPQARQGDEVWATLLFWQPERAFRPGKPALIQEESAWSAACHKAGLAAAFVAGPAETRDGQLAMAWRGLSRGKGIGVDVDRLALVVLTADPGALPEPPAEMAARLRARLHLDPQRVASDQIPALVAVLKAQLPASSQGRSEPAPDPNQLRAQANRLFQAQDFQAAEPLYHRLCKLNAQDGQAWFRLGFCAIRTGHYPLSAKAFHTCLQLGVAPGPSTYNLACAYSLMGDHERGLEYLAQAVEAGFQDWNLARTDPDVEAIRKDPRFEKILAGEGFQPAAFSKSKELRHQDPAQLLQTAQNRFRSQDWDGAVEAYSAYLFLHPENGQAHFQCGYAAIASGRLEVAETCFQKSLELGFAPPISTYNLACTYSRMGKIDAALASLEAAVGRGFQDLEQLKNDSDLEALRGEKGYHKIVKRLQGLNDQAHRMQFWVGRWEVSDADGKRLGTDLIVPQLQGRVLHETWTGEDGYQGVSISTYDPERGVWRQTWMDANGRVVDLEGRWENGSMAMETLNTEGKRTRVRWTPLEDGRIHFLMESSKDQGASWTPSMETFAKPAPADRVGN
ncbi:MAG: tetratricopeptide repeat protein [Planctomycetota bacterium]|nr:MAG: tetratricopeptide repeat protein [Planctomycetota bacterium]